MSPFKDGCPLSESYLNHPVSYLLNDPSVFMSLVSVLLLSQHMVAKHCLPSRKNLFGNVTGLVNCVSHNAVLADPFQLSPQETSRVPQTLYLSPHPLLFTKPFQRASLSHPCTHAQPSPPLGRGGAGALLAGSHTVPASPGPC